MLKTHSHCQHLADEGFNYVTKEKVMAMSNTIKMRDISFSKKLFSSYLTGTVSQPHQYVGTLQPHHTLRLAHPTMKPRGQSPLGFDDRKQQTPLTPRDIKQYIDVR